MGNVSNIYRVSASDRAEAEMWVRLRLSAIGSYRDHLSLEIEEAVREICAIVVRYKGAWVHPHSFSFGADREMSAEIEAVIRRLADSVREMLDDLGSVDDEEVSEESRRAMEERVDEIAEDWSRETEALVLCALFGLKVDEEEMAEAVLEAGDDPWGSEIFKAGSVAASLAGVDNEIINGGIPHFGVGRSNVGAHMFDMAGTAFITNVYGAKQLAGHPDATQFFSETADSRACDNCVDEEKRGWQPIANYQGPWHPNCRCRFFFR